MRSVSLSFVVALVLSVGVSRAEDPIEFNKDVRPILSETCYTCHGPDKGHRKAGLRLDEAASALKKGAIVPGKPNESELIARIFSKDADVVMPPPETHKKLTDKQKATLKKWIEQGGKYESHWAFMPVKEPKVPAVQGPMRNPIDAFVLAELEKRNLTLSPEADKRTLIRRATLDIIGLPPTPEEVQAFLKDESPKAFEKVVDRLLNSPHYGERMATPWLDLVRYADTVGYHGDQNQRVFPYRDYVVNSFNNNMPFDQFTREQLAGDLLPNPTKNQLVATGFNRLNMMTREGGAQPKEYLAKYQGDRVRTVSMTWLGSTLGCAECHDHKYDPFTAKDFYSLSAFFADIRQWGVYSDYGYTPNADLKGWSNDHPFPPEIEIDCENLREKSARLVKECQQLSPAPKPALVEAWTAAMKNYLEKNPTGWMTPPGKPPVTEKGTTVDAGHVVTFTGPPRKAGSQVLQYTPTPGWIASVKLELLPTEKHGGKILRNNAANTTIVLSVLKKGPDGKDVTMKLLHGAADRQDPFKYASTIPNLSLLTGWKTVAGAADKPHTAVYLFDQPFQVNQGDTVTVTLTSDNIGAARVSFSPFGFVDINKPTVPELNANAALLSTGYDSLTFAQSKALRKEIADLRGGKTYSQVTVAQTPITTRILPRGNWMDETGPVVTPAVPGFLPPIPTKPGQRLNRLDLANWIASKDNPLTARVFVNRLWKQIYGQGLSAVMEDVGAQGEWPTHPELLDWLATEFAKDWDVKKMVRLMVTAQTYRQTSRAKPELKDTDPNNRLLAYLSPRRLEAEYVRDNALAVAGLLNKDMGGPSIKPYQPEGYYANIQFPDRKYAATTGRGQFRRGLYSHWQRTFLHPMLANFDAPSREECTASRTNANTPQQALTLLNDPTFVEAARALAMNSLTETDEAKRMAKVFERVLAREPQAKEAIALTKFLQDQRAYFEKNTEEAAKLAGTDVAAPQLSSKAAWVSVCRVLLNLHETITRY